MKVIKTVKTYFAEMSLLEHNILYIDFAECIQDDVEEVKENAKLTRKNFGTELYIIANTTKIKHISREVRNYSATPESSEGYNALAAITGSGVSRIAGNLYLSFHKPSIPTKLFTSFEKAHAWILEERAKNLGIK